VLSDAHYAALLAVIFLTTFVAPILLALFAKTSVTPETEEVPVH